MTKTDLPVGNPLPRVGAVVPTDGYAVAVTWADGRVEAIDLSPALFRYKIYAPLRDAPALLASVRVVDEGYAITWGTGEIDMASTTIEDLAGQAMSAERFISFMTRHGYTLEAVAAELGISRQLAASYQSGRPIPRHIALACAYLDLRRPRKVAAVA